MPEKWKPAEVVELPGLSDRLAELDSLGLDDGEAARADWEGDPPIEEFTNIQDADEVESEDGDDPDDADDADG